MKKLLFKLFLAVVVLMILVIVGIAFFLDSAILRGVETAGPMLTKTPVKLDSVSLSLFSGASKMKGLFVGNPGGFKSPSAIQVGTASLSLQPSSLFGDKVMIKSINVEGPEITFETDLKGNNLSKLLANIDEATGGGKNAPKPDEPAQKKASRKLEVDDFLIRGGKIHVSLTALGGQSATVPLPEIHLTALGQGPEGITAAELAKRVLQAIEKEAVQAASGSVADLSKQAANLTKGLGTNPAGAVENVTKGIGGLFNKK
jgi:hypothetical protein